MVRAYVFPMLIPADTKYRRTLFAIVCILRLFNWADNFRFSRFLGFLLLFLLLNGYFRLIREFSFK